MGAGELLVLIIFFIYNVLSGSDLFSYLRSLKSPDLIPMKKFHEALGLKGTQEKSNLQLSKISIKS